MPNYSDVTGTWEENFSEPFFFKIALRQSEQPPSFANSFHLLKSPWPHTVLCPPPPLPFNPTSCTTVAGPLRCPR